MPIALKREMDKKEFLPVQFEVKNMTSEKTEKGNFAFFEGYAAVFSNEDAKDDIIVKGAFAKTISTNRKIRLLFQHDRYVVIGQVMEAYEDNYGLYVKCRLDIDVEKAAEVYTLLKSGSLDSMSIGFKTIKADFKEINGNVIRYVQEVELFEVSVVTFPANDNAVITDVKSVLLDEAQTFGDVEKYLRCKGLSIKEAQSVISEIKSITLSDSESKNADQIRDEFAKKEAESNSRKIVDEIKSIINKIK